MRHPRGRAVGMTVHPERRRRFGAASSGFGAEYGALPLASRARGDSLLSVDRGRLIGLIEDQTARLSAEGRGLWEELEFLRESMPHPDDPGRMACEYEIMERIFGLSVAEQFLTGVLAELVGA